LDSGWALLPAGGPGPGVIVDDRAAEADDGLILKGHPAARVAQVTLEIGAGDQQGDAVPVGVDERDRVIPVIQAAVADFEMKMRAGS
jgi:hypothetical protein